jgi:uncharacterized protein (TIGR03000 family)
MLRFKLLVLSIFALAVCLTSVQPVTAGGYGGGGGYGGRGGYGYGYRGYGYGYRGGYGVGIGIGFYPGYPYGYYPYPGYVAPYPVPVVVPVVPTVSGVPAVPAVAEPKVLPAPNVDEPTLSAAPAVPNNSPTSAVSTKANNDTALVRVLLPADARLWLQGEATSLTGSERVFASQPLTPGMAYTYQIKARWTQNGRPVEQSATVKVFANKTTTVEFRAPRVSED